MGGKQILELVGKAKSAATQTLQAVRGGYNTFTGAAALQTVEDRLTEQQALVEALVSRIRMLEELNKRLQSRVRLALTIGALSGCAIAIAWVLR